MFWLEWLLVSLSISLVSLGLCWFPERHRGGSCGFRIGDCISEIRKLGNFFVTCRNLDYKYQLHEAGQTLKDEMVVLCNVGEVMSGAVTNISLMLSNNIQPINNNRDRINELEEEQEEFVRNSVN